MINGCFGEMGELFFEIDLVAADGEMSFARSVADRAG